MAFPVSPIEGEVYSNYYYDSTLQSWEEIQEGHEITVDNLIEKDWPEDVIITNTQTLFEMSTGDFISSNDDTPIRKRATVEPVELTDWALNPHAWHLFPKETIVDNGPTNGLVAYYSMLNSSGFPGVNEVEDDSGNGYDATVTGTNPVEMMDGYPPQGKAISFNHLGGASEEYMEIPDAVKPTGGAWTISFMMLPESWVDATALYPTVFGGFGLGVAAAIGGIALTRQFDRLVLNIYDATTKFDGHMSRMCFREQSWHHVVITANASNEVWVYDNGAIVGHWTSVSQNSSINWGSNKFRFGFTGSPGRHSFDGLMTEIRIYDYALTKSEIRAMTSRRVQCAGFWGNRSNLLLDPENATVGTWLKARCAASLEDIDNFHGTVYTRITANVSSGLNYIRQNTLSLTANKGSASNIVRKVDASDTIWLSIFRESDDAQAMVQKIDWSANTPWTEQEDSGWTGEIVDFIWLEEDTAYFAGSGVAPTTTTYKFYQSGSDLSNTIKTDVTRMQVVNEAFVPAYAGKYQVGQGLSYTETLPNSGTMWMLVRVPYIYDSYPENAHLFEWIESTQTGANWYNNNRFMLAFNSVSPTNTDLRITVNNSSGTSVINDTYDLSSDSHGAFGNRYKWHQVTTTWENFNSGSANAVVKIYIDSTLKYTSSTVNMAISCQVLSLGRNGLLPTSTSTFSDRTESLDGWVAQAVLDTNVWDVNKVQQTQEMWYQDGHKFYSPNRVIGKNYAFKKDKYGNRWPT